MKNKRRFILGSVFFALLFFYLGVRIYFVFIHVGSYDGWFGSQKSYGTPAVITRTDPNGPATMLQAGDEILALNGITLAQDPSLLSFSDRVPPGTTYTMTVRRQEQELTFPLTTAPDPQDEHGWGEKAYIFINLIFLLTGLIVFLLKPDNQQAWLLALMLGTYTVLSTWKMPVIVLGRSAEFIVAFVKILGLWSLPLLVRFFLNFPDRSPILQRWPKLESYLNWPLYLFILPYFGAGRLPAWLGQWYFTLPPIKWLSEHNGFVLTMPTVLAYLAAGLICLVVNYRVANQDARRRLRVIMVGSGIGVLTLILVITGEYYGLQRRLRRLDEVMEIAMFISAPLIPLSFAYAIIRHKVIPISVIIRRGVRYLLVSRGAVLLELLTVGIVLTVVLQMLLLRFNASPLVTGIVSALVGIAVWQGTRALHNRFLAPLIDRRFFRQSYDAQQIMAELADSVRTTTNLSHLLELGATKIQAALQTERVTILLRDNATKDYRSAYSCEYSQRNGNAVNCAQEFWLSHNAEIVARLNETNTPLEVNGKEETSDLKSLEAALLLPLKGKDEMAGIIALGERLGDLPFSNEDKRLLMSVGAPMSFALENTRLIERMIEEARRREELEAENEQRAKELEEARQLQLSMLPKQVPQLPDLEIAAYMKTATEVGGDYYDFHVADDGTLTVAVGDATGHGLKAGTVVTATKSLFHELANGDDLPDMLKRFSHALKQMNLRSLFMALTVVKVKNHRLTLTVAGMPPILIYRAANNHVEEVFLKALPLGSIAKYNYKQEEYSLHSGDLIMLMSDGFPERFNQASEMLGYDKAKTLLTEAAGFAPAEIIARFVQIGEEWADNKPPDDDVTFVVMKVK